METPIKQPNQHIGRKIGRIRELRGIKQDVLAAELGLSQQSISRLEQSEEIEEELLDRVAKILGVNKEAIHNFSEEAVFNYFNTFNDNSGSNGAFGNHHQCTFNPLDKVMDLVEENKKLYERLLQSEKEKLELALKGK